ncbi:hypothetical protein PAHAL_5G504100 [Panicum hallii]|uniref:Uncharacterized protein n=1 Tax=Panicum hallii TaxID=206008 RepID=A0A2S3HYH9_9POAL|nr:hypothetical protein PAHAL_5G504100 [Panicum hallii]
MSNPWMVIKRKADSYTLLASESGYNTSSRRRHERLLANEELRRSFSRRKKKELCRGGGGTCRSRTSASFRGLGKQRARAAPTSASLSRSPPIFRMGCGGRRGGCISGCWCRCSEQGTWVMLKK